MWKSQMKRSFYTVTNPKNCKVIKLEDGSSLFLKQPTPALTQLPPRLKNYPKTAILTPDQIEEIKFLRESDPDVNTVDRLAKKFNTFPGMIMRHTQCPRERKERLEKEAEAEFNSLSLTGKKRIIDRMRRKALW